MDQGGGVMNIETGITGTLRSQTKGHEPVIMSTGHTNAEITHGYAPTLTAHAKHEAPILALAGNTIGRKPENGGNGCGYQEDISYTLTKTDEHGIMQGTAVRRLTPRECERLQGFPDDWTRIPWRGKPAEECPDGPRYKACGNSMAVPVMRWIGERISLLP
jgi:DNA (cytosine-5)-methyltransferase 1